MMEIAIGFVVAVLVGVTGVGGGSFTTPLLVLVCGISGAEAVGTALVFSTVIKVAAAPFYVAAKRVHLRYLSLMLLGVRAGPAGGHIFSGQDARTMESCGPGDHRRRPGDFGVTYACRRRTADGWAW